MGRAQRPALAVLSAALRVAASPVWPRLVGGGHIGREHPQEPVSDVGGRRDAVTGPIPRMVWTRLVDHGCG